MSIDEAIALACQHFVEHYQTGTCTQQLFECFAAEEYGYKGDDRTEYAISRMVTGFSVKRLKDALEFYRFYTWYYINYVATPAKWKPKT